MAKPVYALVNGSWVLVGSTTAHAHTITDITGLQAALDNKANTTDVNTQLNTKLNSSEKGASNGVASLDGSGTIPDSQISTAITRDSELSAGLSAKADLIHTHTKTEITDLPLLPDPAGVTAGNLWTADGSNSAAWLPPNYKKQTITASVIGGLAPTIGTTRFYNDTGSTWQVVSVRAQVEEAPTGAAILIDVNLNGTTIFTNQANRPQIAAGQNYGNKTTPDVLSIPDGSYLTIDIDSVGTITYGADLMVQIVVV